jgi:hypothetical protein
MRKILFAIAAVVATTILGAGVAEAGPRTYDVTQRWSYSFVDGELELLPPMQDDYLEVTCRNGDKMKGYKTEPPARIADVWRRTDGTGIQVEPILGDEPVEFTITVTCWKR